MRPVLWPLGDGVNSNPAITNAERKYNLIGLQGNGTGCCYLMDEDRKAITIALPAVRLKNIGSKSRPCYALFLKGNELINFADELSEVYDEWIIGLKGYKKADTEQMLKTAARNQRAKNGE